MLLLVFLAYAFLEWFFAKRKPARERWTVFVLLLAVAVWNAFAFFMSDWLTPNQLIRLAFGWLD